MKIKITDIPQDLQPIAYLINQLQAMYDLAPAAKNEIVADAQKAIANQAAELVGKFPESREDFEKIKPNFRNYLEVPWLEHANRLRELLLRTLRWREAEGKWRGGEVDLELQRPPKPPAATSS